MKLKITDYQEDKICAGLRQRPPKVAAIGLSRQVTCWLRCGVKAGERPWQNLPPGTVTQGVILVFITINSQ